MMKPQTLIVVTDGESAVIWRNHGHASPELEMVERVDFSNLPHGGPSGHAPEDQSKRELNEATFIKLLVHKLNAMALANGLPDEVIIIADPDSLGQMRPQYHGELKRRIVKEIAKTLVKASKHDLEKALA